MTPERLCSVIQFYCRFGFEQNHFALHVSQISACVALRDDNEYPPYSYRGQQTVNAHDTSGDDLNISMRLPEIQVVINKNVGRDSSEASVGQKKH
jgi:hypothetical protein